MLKHTLIYQLATFGENTSTNSSVYEYTRELISLGLLLLDYKDAMREGDGDRIMIMWKYFMLIFKATGHTNYALEAQTLLSQYYVIFPPCYAEKLKWSHFINCHGFPGHNISCDLHIEHINRKIKTAIEGLGADKSEKAIVRTGNCIGPLDDILSSYDKTAKIYIPSGKHSRHSISKELDKLIQELLTYGAFDKSSGKTA